MPLFNSDQIRRNKFLSFRDVPTRLRLHFKTSKGSPNMSEPQVVDSFLARLAKSKLLPLPRIKKVAREYSLHALSTDVEVARTLVEHGAITRFQADRLLEGRYRGFYFDQYKVLDILGMGGMGWVYQAEDTRSGQIVALKVLLDHLKNDQGMLARFRQEARAGLQLNDPHILRTYRFDHAGDLPYLILEFHEGLTLLELLQGRGKLPWPQVCDIIRQAAIGLHHGHQKGLVHRDVKPQNLVIDRSGHVKVLDFGLALISDGEAGDEFSMAMIFGHDCPGTVAYMAPEHAENSLHVDARADIYSLGCTFHALLTGTVPFPRKSVAELLEAHRSETPRSVRELVPSIPEEVAAIVARMLAKDPARRFQTAAEVGAVLAPRSEPAPVKFDFAAVLAERLKQARAKMALLQRGRRSLTGTVSTITPPGSSSSAARTSSTHHPLHLGEIEDTDVSLQHLSPSDVCLGNPFGLPRDTPPRRDPFVLLQNQCDESANLKPENSRLVQSRSVLVSLDTGQNIPLAKAHILVGRRDDCGLKLLGPEVSGRHCELHFDGQHWWITDLGSRNGTRVNGVAVTNQLLRPGDQLTLANHHRFRLNYNPGYVREAVQQIREDIVGHCREVVGRVRSGISRRTRNLSIILALGLLLMAILRG